MTGKLEGDAGQECDAHRGGKPRQRTDDQADQNTGGNQKDELEAQGLQDLDHDLFKAHECCFLR